MVVTHVAAPPMAGSNRAAVRHTSRRTSWATSSDWDGSRRTFLMTPYTGPTIRSYSVSNASWSPRATWTSRSSRSCSPLLSAAAGLNLDASESFGFIWHLRSGSSVGWVAEQKSSDIFPAAVAWSGGFCGRGQGRLRGGRAAHVGDQPPALLCRGRLCDRRFHYAQPGLDRGRSSRGHDSRCRGVGRRAGVGGRAEAGFRAGGHGRSVRGGAGAGAGAVLAQLGGEVAAGLPHRGPADRGGVRAAGDRAPGGPGRARRPGPGAGPAHRAAARGRADDAGHGGAQPGQRAVRVPGARVVAVVAGAGDVRHVDGDQAAAAGLDQGAGGAVRGGFGVVAAGVVPAAAGFGSGGGQGAAGVRARRLAGGAVPVYVLAGHGGAVGGAAAAGPGGAALVAAGAGGVRGVLRVPGAGRVPGVAGAGDAGRHAADAGRDHAARRHLLGRRGAVLDAAGAAAGGCAGDFPCCCAGRFGGVFVWVFVWVFGWVFAGGGAAGVRGPVLAGAVPVPGFF